jgi:hypothetical protein
VCLDNTTLLARLVTRNRLRPRHHGLIPVHCWSVSFSYLRSAAGVSFDIKKACRKPYSNKLFLIVTIFYSKKKSSPIYSE